MFTGFDPADEGEENASGRAIVLQAGFPGLGGGLAQLEVVVDLFVGLRREHGAGQYPLTLALNGVRVFRVALEEGDHLP